MKNGMFHYSESPSNILYSNIPSFLFYTTKVMLPGQYDGVDTGLNESEMKILSQGSAQLRYTGFYALVSLLLSSTFLFN